MATPLCDGRLPTGYGEKNAPASVLNKINVDFHFVQINNING